MKAYCNLQAIEKGLDPGGHATPFNKLVLLETRLPWQRDLYSTASLLPQEVVDLYTLNMQRYRQTGRWDAAYLLLIAPDVAYSRPGWRRIIFFQQGAAQFAQFARAEYVVPEPEAGKLVWALAEAPDTLAQFAAWKIADSEPWRDILVCTHGSVDAACAKFGFPLYRHLRQTYATESLRVWRVSHFGGHVFAPTLMDMPSGHFWAYVEEAQAAQIVERTGPVADLRGHYRGWAGLPNGFLQAAEREMWLREGWRWFTWPKKGQLVAQDQASSPAWAEVCVQFEADGGQYAYKACVEVVKSVETIHTTGYSEVYPYLQYRVTRLERG